MKISQPLKEMGFFGEGSGKRKSYMEIWGYFPNIE